MAALTSQWPWTEAEKQWLKKVKADEAPPALFLHGCDVYRVRYFLDALRERAPGGCAFMDGAAVDGAEILERLQTADLFAMSSGLRLVVVREANQMKGWDEVFRGRQLQVGADHPWPGVLLLLLSDTLDGRRKHSQALKKIGLTLELNTPQSAELPAFVAALAAAKGLALESEAAALLALMAADGIAPVASEIEKLVLYLGDEKRPATRADVERVSAVAVTYDMAELVKAVVEGRRARAMLRAGELIKAPEDALGFVGFLTWCLKNPDKFRWQKRPDVARLYALADGLLELDTRLKSAGLDPRIPVEAFIIT